jgi:hypothetical protein
MARSNETLSRSAANKASYQKPDDDDSLQASAEPVQRRCSRRNATAETEGSPPQKKQKKQKKEVPTNISSDDESVP